MERTTRTVNASIQHDSCVFSMRDVFYFLAHIQELKNYKIRLRQRLDGAMQLQIGESVYTVYEDVETEIL